MKYKFDINVGYGCNFRCNYCFEKLGDKNYENKCMSDEVIERSIEYIKHLSTKTLAGNDITLCFYGGEPLLYINIIEKFIDQLKDNENILYCIMTNGTLIRNYRTNLLKLKHILKNKLNIGVSYDYALQNKNRQENTYDIVRKNIIWLYDNKFNVDTGTVFPRGDLPKFYDVFLDFIELRKRIPTMRLRYNIDRVNASDTSFDEEETRKALKKTKAWIIEHNLNRSAIYYNNSCKYRGDRAEDCIVGEVYASVCVTGDIYPMYNVMHALPNIRDMLYLGNVFDDFDELDKKHKELFSSLNFIVPEECVKCKAPCRVLPWRTIKNGSIDEFNTMPSEEHCRIHQILYEELNFNE